MALIPNSPDPYQNLGTVLYRQRRLQDAVEIFRRGLQVAPESAHLTENLGYAALALGDYELGFACWEARWRIDLYRSGWHQSTAPTWDGARSLAGKTILLFAEQGLGDTMQFVRFVPELAARGARVLLMVQQPLVSLLRGVQGVEACFGLDDKPPRYDVQYPLLSLPHALGTRLDDIPADIPYLAAEPGSVAAWRERLASIPGLKIGLVWAGDPRPHQPEASRLDRRRSVRFDQLAPLAGIAGVSFVSLQKGKAAEQARTALPDLELHDWTSELNSFADTAALVEALDVVISVDTSVVHLGGALGRPVWLLNRFDSCWRWLDGRDDSPWYPTLRQFRQARPGDWDEVLARVRAALETLAAA
jgi:tetratricopeptide (TPR) repeat protein